MKGVGASSCNVLELLRPRLMYRQPTVDELHLGSHLDDNDPAVLGVGSDPSQDSVDSSVQCDMKIAVQ